jgi:hypothetical protein
LHDAKAGFRRGAGLKENLGMKRSTRWGIIVIFVAATGLAAAADRVMTAKEIMGKLNKGPNALTPNLKRELQKDVPDWVEIEAEAKQYATLTAALGKAAPAKGDKNSWARLTKDYAESAKALDVAVQGKNKNAALAAHAKLSSACMNCHKAHRE